MPASPSSCFRSTKVTYVLHETAGPGALGFVRIVVFGLWFVLVAITPLHLLAELPGFIQLGVLSLLPGGFWDWFLQPVPLSLFRVGLAGLLLLTAAGAAPYRVVALLSVLGLLLFDGTAKGYGGFVNHGRFALLYTAVLLSLQPGPGGLRWGRNEAERVTETEAIEEGEGTGLPQGPLPPEQGSVLRLAALLMGVAYALVGLYRMAAGGAAIFLDDSLPTYLMVRTFEPGGYSFGGGYAVAGSAGWLILLKAGFVATTLAEIVSPLAVFVRWVRWAWLAVIVPFHFATLFTMNIFFWENLVLIVVLFTGLPTWIEGRLRSSGSRDAGPRISAIPSQN